MTDEYDEKEDQIQQDRMLQSRRDREHLSRVVIDFLTCYIYPHMDEKQREEIHKKIVEDRVIF